MPRKRPKASDLPTEAALKKMFPKKVRDEVKKKALESEKRSTKKDSN